MSTMDWFFVISIAVTIIILLGSIYFFVRIVRIKKQLKKLPSKKIKNKKKWRMIVRKRKLLIKERKNSFKWMIILVLITCILAGATGYISYYQAMNLTKNDSNSVVKGYYLLRDFEQQLNLAKEKGDEEEKLQKNIRYLSTAMASYGTTVASKSNSEKGQLILNRYYNSIKQVGMNASTQTKNFYGNEQLVDSFLEDLKKTENYEKEAFSYYKVDEAAFSEEK